MVLVSNENDALFDVLEGVLDLDAENMSLLARQLRSLQWRIWLVQ